MNSTRIDDPLENQLKFVIRYVLRLVLMAVEADRGDVKRFILVDVIPVGFLRDPSVFGFTFFVSETLKFHFSLSLGRVGGGWKGKAGGKGGLTRSTSAALTAIKPSLKILEALGWRSKAALRVVALQSLLAHLSGQVSCTTCSLPFVVDFCGDK